jgi:hypothetical protein
VNHSIQVWQFYGEKHVFECRTLFQSSLFASKPVVPLYVSTGVWAKGEPSVGSLYSSSLLSGRKLIVVTMKILSEELTVAAEERAERDEFRRRLREEWRLLWSERFDDRVRAEGVAARDYQLFFTDCGRVIFATTEAKARAISRIVWTARLGKARHRDLFFTSFSGEF